MTSTACDARHTRGLGARFALALVTLALLVGGQACAEKPAAARALKPRSDVPGVKNFARVSPILTRGAQPTADGFKQLQQMGVKTILCLRAKHDDRKLLEGTGLRYVQLSCDPWHPKDDEVAKFFRIVRDPANQPVFVHCKAGADRTGTMVALYRTVEQGWTVEDAIAELKNFNYHPIFMEIVPFLKKFDRRQLDGLVDRVEAPDVEVIH